MEAKSGDKIELSNESVRSQLRDLARNYFLEALAKLNEDIELGEDEADWNPAERASETEELIQQHTARFLQGKFPSYVTATADELLAQHLTTGTADLELRRYLKKLLMRGEIEAQRIFLSKVSGHFGKIGIQDELFQGLDVDTIRPIPSVDAQGRLSYEEQSPVGFVLLESAIDKFLAGKTVKGKRTKTVEDIETVLKLFRLIMPAVKHVRQITKATVVDFEIELGSVPANYSKSKTLKNLTFTALKAASNDLEKFSPATYDKYVITLRSFVKWCQYTDLLENWSLPPYEARNKKSKAKLKRNPFTEAELKSLFTSPQ